MSTSTRDSHPSVQNGGPRERKKVRDWLGPNALLIVLLVGSVQPQREFRESRKLVSKYRNICILFKEETKKNISS